MVFSNKLIDGQITLGTGVEAREGSDFRFKGDSTNLPLICQCGLQCVFCPLMANSGKSW